MFINKYQVTILIKPYPRSFAGVVFFEYSTFCFSLGIPPGQFSARLKILLLQIPSRHNVKLHFMYIFFSFMHSQFKDFCFFIKDSERLDML
jgi:hypothetical protein